MSYTALYRRLRPDRFSDVVGQNHITTTLINQIKSNRISHAYLFCGTRGTGKTTVARIFAKAINCIDLQNGEPCMKCEICRAINQQKSFNIIEIDAASNNSVDNIRDINEEVKYPPSDGKYKVYIIDEVHMLSTGAYNALLKTLEEPPEHIVFILATTDPQKVPATIHSRCQRFDFRRISAVDMLSALKKYMAEENVDIDEEALLYITSVTDGAMRDALSTLEQVLAFYYGKRITLDNVLDVLGSVSDDILFDLTDSLFEKNGKKCLEITDNVLYKGKNLKQFTDDMINHLRNILVADNVTDNTTSILNVSHEKFEKLKQQGSKVNPNYIIELINIFSNTQNTLKYSTNDRVIFETTCLKICNPVTLDDYENILLRLKNLEDKFEKGIMAMPDENKVQSIQKNDKPIEEKPIIKKEIIEEKNILKENLSENTSSENEKILDNWRDFLQTLNPIERLILMKQKACINKDTVIIYCESDSAYEKLLDKKELYTEKLSAFYKTQLNLSIKKNSTEKVIENKKEEYNFDKLNFKVDIE